MLAILAAAALAGPGDHVAAWTHQIVTDDGDALLEPGETATVTLTVDLSVNPPDNGVTGEAICGWAIAAFDVLNAAGDAQVTDWEVLEHYAWITGDLTTTDGVNLYNVNASNIRQLFYQCEPCTVFEFTIETGEFTGHPIEYATVTSQMLVIEGTDWCEAYHPGGQVVEWPVAEADIVIEVACAADANADGLLNILDWVAFHAMWHNEDPGADCNGDGELSILDYICFQQRFVKGCA